MSMTNEELQRTGVLKTILDKDNNFDDDEMTIGERIEELEERIEYLDIEDERKDKIRNLIDEIKKDDVETSKEFKFNHLMKLID